MQNRHPLRFAHIPRQPHRYIHPDEPAHSHLRRHSRCASVFGNHRTRFVTRPVLHPRFALPVRERYRDKRRTRIMKAHALPAFALLEQHWPRDSRCAQMFAILIRHSS